MSNFLLNLARRGAGLGPGVSIEPASDPVFSPTAGDMDPSHRFEEPSEESRPVSEPARMIETQRDPEPLRSVVEPLLPSRGEDLLPPLKNKLSSAPPDIKEKKTTPARETQITANSTKAAVDQPHMRPPTLDVNVPSITPVVPAVFESRVESIESIQAPPFATISANANATTPTAKRPIAPALPEQEGGNYAEQIITTRQVFTPTPSDFQFNRISSQTEEAATILIEPAVTVLESSAALPSLQQQQAPQPIHVRIGTIEVRAEQPPPVRAPNTQSQTPKRGFDDYKFIR